MWSTSCATASGSPSATTSTAPSSRLRAQPATPSDSALRRVESRKKTPCTRPWATMRRRTPTSGPGLGLRLDRRRQQLVDLGEVRAHPRGHGVDDLGRLVDLRLGPGELLLDAAHVLH